MQFCNDCGAQNPDDGKFCNECGAALVVPAGGAAATVASPQLASAPPIVAGLPNTVAAPSPAQPVAAAALTGTAPNQTVALDNTLHGRYAVLKLLAQGGMGAVYLAQDSSVFNRLLVVKEMLRYYNTAEEQKQAEYSFEREARLLANLSNPGVPKIFDYFIENGNYYLVMEFAEGENLQDRMARLGRPMSEVEVLPIAVQMANILVYTARQNPPVIHRDIKPANVIIGPDEQVKLVDFGIAKTTAGAGATTGLTAPVGTPGYAPPEQYQGQTQPRTDIYALGALLHYLLTGRDPTAGMPFNFPPVRSLAPQVSPPLEALIGEMLCMDALQRPDAVQLRARLEALSPQATTPSPSFQPFVFRAGTIAGTLHELAQACDKHWDEAVEHLYNGDFESWLNLAGRPDLAKRADTVRRRGGDSSLGLEEFIRAIDHTMLMPSLAVDQAVLQLGPVQRGEKRMLAVRLMNAGRGYLSGQVNNAAAWVRVAPRLFGLRQGQQVQLSVTIDTTGWPEGSFGQTAFMADSTGGQAVVAVAADVTWPPELGIEPAGMLDFGAVADGEARAVTTTFRVRNMGGGTLDGTLVAACPWISLDQSSFSLISGQELVVSATADPAFIGSAGAANLAGQGPGAGQGLIRITTPAGTRDTSARIRVQKQWYTGAPRISAWLGHGLLALLGYLGLAIPLAALIAILLGWPAPSTRVLLLLGALLVASGPAFMAAKSWTARLDEIEDFHHRGRLSDELIASRFDVRKLAVLGGVGFVFGALLGYHFGRYVGVGSPGGLLALGAVAGGLGGALLAAEGVAPVGAVGAKPAFMSGTAYEAIRTVILAVVGALFGTMLGFYAAGGVVRPIGGILGALIGLLLSSESHRWLSARVRWLLQIGRHGAFPVVGAFVGACLVGLLLVGFPLTASGYGYMPSRANDLREVLWPFLMFAGSIVGVYGGLWAVDMMGRPARVTIRAFAGLSAITVLLLLPVYLFAAALAGRMPDVRVPIVSAIIIGAAALIVWAIRKRSPQVQMFLSRLRARWFSFWDPLARLAPNTLRGFWHRSFGALPDLNRVKGRVPGTGARQTIGAAVGGMSVAELSAGATIAMALAVIGFTWLEEMLFASFAVPLIIALATVLLYVLIALVVIGAVALVIRYFRQKTP